MELLLISLAIIVIIISILTKRKNITFSKKSENKEITFLYKKKDYIFSKAEYQFFKALHSAIEDKNYYVFSKVRLADLLYIPKESESKAIHWNKIKSKHVDFVLCDKNNYTPLLIIELDDSSHKKDNRKERDIFVDKAFSSANLPIIHIPVNFSYDINNLKNKIENAMIKPEKIQMPGLA